LAINNFLKKAKVFFKNADKRYVNNKGDIMKTVKVKSSTIKALSYKGSTLTVGFNSGAIYEYRFVPKKVFLEMAKAKSVGAYFASNVRDAFSFEKVEVK
jgi:hypothetical protein